MIRSMTYGILKKTCEECENDIYHITWNKTPSRPIFRRFWDRSHKMASTVQRLFSFAVVRQIFDNYEFANYWIYLDIILSILGSQIHRWYVEYK